MRPTVLMLLALASVAHHASAFHVTPAPHAVSATGSTRMHRASNMKVRFNIQHLKFHCFFVLVLRELWYVLPRFCSFVYVGGMNTIGGGLWGG